MKTFGKYGNFTQLKDFLVDALSSHIYTLNTPSASAKKYRVEHCLRVALIGRQVALAENLDPDILEIGCLLHDIGKWEAEKAVDHGRCGALIAEDLLKVAGLSKPIREEITQGIAMHVDGYWNPRPDTAGTPQNIRGEKYKTFSQQPTLLAQSIRECDDIDRYSAYRIHDTLTYFNFLEKSTTEQQAWIADYLLELYELQKRVCVTATTQKLWQENITFQITYYEKLAKELNKSLS